MAQPEPRSQRLRAATAVCVVAVACAVLLLRRHRPVEGTSSGEYTWADSDGGLGAKGGGEGATSIVPSRVAKQIACGDHDCSSESERCCRAPNRAVCQPKLQDCEVGIPMACDESADCPDHERCCVTDSAVVCAVTCRALRTDRLSQLCARDGECPSGLTCRDALVGSTRFLACR